MKNLRTDPRRGLLLGLAVLCLVSAPVIGHLGFAPWAWARSSETQDPARSAARSEDSFQTLSEFINRSPGERGEVDRIKGIIKSMVPPPEAPSPKVPSQRALGKIFKPEPFGIFALQEGPIEPLIIPIETLGTPAGLIPFGPATNASGSFGSGAGAGPGSLAVAPFPSAPSDGGGSSGGGGGGGTDNPAPPPVGAVPEPSTWALLLMGFFGVGFGLRRDHAATKQRGWLVSK